MRPQNGGLRRSARSRPGRRPALLLPSTVVLRLTQEHVDRAVRIARWYGRRARRAEITDLESAALEGLAKAARDWDPKRCRGQSKRGARKRSFWSFAFIRIMGEMRDELRRFDHLTRDQRAKVVEDSASGELALDDEELTWIDPLEPISLDADVSAAEARDPVSLVELVEDERNPIEEFELRDLLYRAGARLPDRVRFLVVMHELEGYSNCDLALAIRVSEGRASQLRGAAFDRMRGHIGDSLLDAA